MTGTPTYTPIEITFVLTAIVQNTRHTLISEDFEAKFGRKLGANQIRYIKNKYGKDPRYKYVSPLPSLPDTQYLTLPAR